MAFEVRDYYDFVRLLYQHPEWQEELGNLLIAKEIRELPQIVRELAEAQKRTEQRVEELAEAQKRTEQRVEELAEAQKRTEQRVEELAEAQKRTEQRVEELAEAQKRSEERLTRLEQAVAELAEAQKRTEQRVNTLAEELQKTRSEVAKLTTTFGATLEEEAASVLKAVLRRKGYRLLTEEASLAWNGEVDVLLMAETPEGRRFSILVESKARLSEGDVYDWHQRVHSEGWQKRLREAGYPGPYLFYFYAIRADVGAQDALEKKGIGLLKSEGEVIAPRGGFGG